MKHSSKMTHSKQNTQTTKSFIKKKTLELQVIVALKQKGHSNYKLLVLEGRKEDMYCR